MKINKTENKFKTSKKKIYNYLLNYWILLIFTNH